MANLEGQCLCGQFTYSSKADPVATVVCHCKNCQRQSGAAFSVNVVLPADAIETKGELKTFVDSADSGNTVSREFCGTCGSPIFSKPSANAGIVVVKAGTLNDTSALQPGAELWCDSAQAWTSPIGDLPRFPKNPQ